MTESRKICTTPKPSRKFKVGDLVECDIPYPTDVYLVVKVHEDNFIDAVTVYPKPSGVVVNNKTVDFRFFTGTVELSQ